MAQLYVECPQEVALVNQKGERFRDVKSVAGKEEDAGEIPPINMCSFIMRYVVHEVRLIPATRPNEQPTVEPKIGKGYDGSLRVADLHDAFKPAKPGDLVAVDKTDWEVVDSILKEVMFANQWVAGQLAPFLRAWRAAAGHDEKWKKERDAEKAAKANGEMTRGMAEVNS